MLKRSKRHHGNHVDKDALVRGVGLILFVVCFACLAFCVHRWFRRDVITYSNHLSTGEALPRDFMRNKKTGFIGWLNTRRSPRRAPAAAPVEVELPELAPPSAGEAVAPAPPVEHEFSDTEELLAA
eukprot:TRINITY_DN12093_c0_g5_i1.p3 TRINITY_DN12093_c0_g5~~TRINITY_DN12093_c0_g5_i1.p3  ORF type:complete len:126 (+),score=38.48 TRINITY_DN12093_c0_g5_i1:54-431(+)